MLNRPLLIVIVVLTLSTLSFGYLSYKFYSDKALVESRLEVALEANKSLQSSIEKQEKQCELGVGIGIEFEQEKTVINNTTNDVLAEIDSMRSAPLVVEEPKEKVVQNVQDKKDDTVSLDTALPGDLAGLLKRHCDGVQGQACSNP